MSDHYHTEVYKGFRIVLDIDSDPENPRKSHDNFGKMICFHRRYNLGDDHSYGSPQDVVLALTGLSEDDLGRNPNDDLGDGSKYRIVWEPLYLYDHSGITMKTTPFSCPWDSGQVGLIYATYDDILKAFDIQPIKPEVWEPTKDIVEKAEALLKAEVETYDTYIRGEVLGFRVFGPDTDREDPDDDLDEDNDEHWQDDEEDSCWGFYGKEAALEAAKESIDAIVDQG